MQHAVLKDFHGDEGLAMIKGKQNGSLPQAARRVSCHTWRVGHEEALW